MSQLNREFSERDIQRMRNIISGNTANSTRIQSGYTKEQVKHTEGDIWEENGKTWTIHNGIKQTVTKQDALKAMVEFPLTCPCCSKPMKDISINRKMYNIHQKCFDCVIEMEHELKKNGSYEEYEQTKIQENALAWLASAERDVEMLKQTYTQAAKFVTNSEGEIETWAAKMSPEEFDQTVQAQFDIFKENFLKNLDGESNENN